MKLTRRVPWGRMIAARNVLPVVCWSFSYLPVFGQYPGIEPNAPWRAEAAARIEAIRKDNLHVSVTDSSGRPIQGANIAVDMRQHEFGFGSAVQANRLASSSPSNQIYKDKVEQLFNLTTIENHMKWPPWIGEWGPSYSQQDTVAAVQWLHNRDIGVRGHALVWPGYNNLPSSMRQILDSAPLNATQQQQMRNLIAAHITDIANRFDGQLTAWDVVNEPRSNHDVMDNLPEGNMAMVDWFQQARSIDPDARLYLNDYGILNSGGGTNTPNQQQHYDFAQFLKNNGAPIDGIGFQGHFVQGDLTGPVQLWTIFDRFAQLDLDMQITEFDLNTTNEALQAAYTRDIMTATFAHEAMDAFVMWGFWQNAHWRPNAAMFRSDWSIKPNGEMYLDLVFNQWWTDVDTFSDEFGQSTIRAFKGKHDVTIAFDSFSSQQEITLTTGGAEINVALPFLLGDFDADQAFSCNDVNALTAMIAQGNYAPLFDLNFDGNVNSADLNWWLARAGEANLPSQGAYLPGDANLDGVVDGSDFNTWNSHKFTAQSEWCRGDFNADGLIDGSDFNTWNSNKFQSSSDPSTVPEPAMLGGGIIALLSLRRSRP